MLWVANIRNRSQGGQLPAMIMRDACPGVAPSASRRMAIFTMAHSTTDVRRVVGRVSCGLSTV